MTDSDPDPDVGRDGQSEDRTDPTADGSTDGGILASDRLRRAAHIVGILLLAAMVLPFVLYAVPQLVGAEHSYVVLSGSMQPTMAPGDVTFVDEVEPNAISEEDVINFKRPQDERTTTHRVIEVVQRDGAPAFRTKGDNNEDPDQGVVTSDQLQGRVMYLGGTPLVIPLVGYAISFVNTQTGFALLFVVPVTLLVLNEVWNVLGAAQSDTAESDPTGDRDSESGDVQGAVVGSDGPDRNPTDDETDGDGSTVSFSPAELRLGIGVLAAFAGYAVWVAVSDPAPFSIGVAGSTTVALLMLGGLYSSGRNASDESDGRNRDTATDLDGVVVELSPVPGDTEHLQYIPISDIGVLIDLARTADGVVGRDPDDDTLHLVAESTLYVYEPAADADDGSDAPGERTNGHQTESTAPADSPADSPAVDELGDEDEREREDDRLAEAEGKSDSMDEGIAEDGRVSDSGGDGNTDAGEPAEDDTGDDDVEEGDVETASSGGDDV